MEMKPKQVKRQRKKRKRKEKKKKKKIYTEAVSTFQYTMKTSFSTK
jgi:hypothetical protein